LSAAGAPKGAVGARSSADASEPRWAGEPPLRGGLAPSSPGRPSAPPFRGGVEWGIQGKRGWSSRPSEEVVAGPALRRSRAPEGDWGRQSPGGPRSLRGKPRVVRFPPGVVFPRKDERSHRVDSTRRERPPGGRAEARLSGPRIGLSGAEAPLVRLRVSRRPLGRRSAVGASARAPPRTARACRSVRGRPLRPCRWSVVPEGQLDPRVVPKRGVGPTPSRGHRSAPGFLAPPKRFLEGAFLVAQDRETAEGVAPKRPVFPLPLRAEARAGRPHRPQAGGRWASFSRDRAANRAGSRGASRRAGRAEATLRLEEARIRPERMWSRQRTFRRMACR